MSGKDLPIGRLGVGRGLLVVGGIKDPLKVPAVVDDDKEEDGAIAADDAAVEEANTDEPPAAAACAD